MANRFAKAAAIAGFAGTASLWTTGAWATASGTRIVNTVTVNFDVGGVSQTPETGSTGFVVDRKIDLQVIDQGSITDARPNQTGRELVFKVVNEGNDAQKIDIDVTLNQSFSGTALSIETGAGALGAAKYRVHISDDATFDGVGTDLNYDPSGFALADTPTAYDGVATTNDEFYVIIVVNVPADAVDNDTVKFNVKATALNDAENGALTESIGNGLDDAGTPANAVDIVFADGAKTADVDAGVTDTGEDGMHTDASTLTVSSAALTASKAVTIIHDNADGSFTCATDADPAPLLDPNTLGAIPGACLEYTITVANGGAANENASNVTISDTLPSGVTFSAFTETTDWTNPAHAAGVVTADLTNALTPGGSSVLKFRVTVD